MILDDAHTTPASPEIVPMTTFNRRRFLMMVTAVVLNSCGNNNSSEEIASIEQPATPGLAVAPETTPTTTAKLNEINGAGDVVEQADRETTPEVLDCSDIPIIVLGDSISLNWPLMTEKMLNDMPDVANVKITNMALAGSTSVSRNPISDKAPKIIETAKSLESYTPEQRKKMVVMFTNGAPEISNLSPNETDETAVQRSVDATTYIYTYLKNLGIGNVIVLPMAPVTRVAEFLQKTPLNQRITSYNREMVEKGLIPEELASYEDMQDPDKYGSEAYYDDTVSELMGVADGEHPDSDGEEVMARSVAELLRLSRYLPAVCKAA